MKKGLLLALALLSGILLMGLASATDISSCGYTITSPDTYYLTNDITSTGSSDCIVISSNDVIIDCQGYSISLTSGATETFNAISTYTSGNDNVQIRNCIIEGRWLFGILGQSGNNYWWIKNNTMKDDIAYGVFYDGFTGLIERNRINTTNVYNGDDFAIQLQGQSIIIRHSILKSSGEVIRMNAGATDVLIYNNYLEGYFPIGEWDDYPSVINFFNTTEYAGTNIIGGSSIGGNWYSNYNGTDGNGDGFGDTPYTIYNTQFPYGTHPTGMADELPLVFFVNTPPAMTGIAISPATAYADSTLNCSATYTDFDSDAGSVTITWSNGTTTETTTLTGISADSLVSLVLTSTPIKGETWNCSINASDGTDESALVSTTRTISNSAPQMDSVALNTPLNDVTDPVCTAIASDTDGDSLILNFTWILEGTIISSELKGGVSNTSTISPVDAGMTIECEVFASDGTEDSGTLSDSTTIGYENPFAIQCPRGNTICHLLQGTGAGFGIFLSMIALPLGFFMVAIVVIGGIVAVIVALAKRKELT